VGAPVQLTVQVTPRAEADRIGRFAGGVLHLRVKRPPADGEANDAVRALLARSLGLPRSSILLVAGARSRVKRFAIDGISSADLAARLSAMGN